MNGIGPYKERVKTINAYWGGLTESNHFGTPSF
jgi:alpha-L-arabinofuranosidase